METHHASFLKYIKYMYFMSFMSLCCKREKMRTFMHSYCICRIMIICLRFSSAHQPLSPLSLVIRSYSYFIFAIFTMSQSLAWYGRNLNVFGVYIYNIYINKYCISLVWGSETYTFRQTYTFRHTFRQLRWSCPYSSFFFGFMRRLWIHFRILHVRWIKFNFGENWS